MGRIKDDKIRLHIEVNGNMAKKELGRLEKEAFGLATSYKKLAAEKKKLDRTDAHYKQNLSAINKKMREQKFLLDQNKTSQKALRAEMGLAGMTLRQLNAEMAKLRAIKANLTPGTAEFKKIKNQMKLVQAQITKRI